MENIYNEIELNNTEKTLLRFLTCGSVDDGKSTLIGHMLYDAHLIYTDQEEALEKESASGSRGGEIDYSLLLDGLMAEREQGITIDVAYRYFSTPKRSFIVADCPGHEEYTRNMAVGASFADLAVILIDASKGVLIQTKRHTRICDLMGICHYVFVVNKMDLVDYSETVFSDIKKDIEKMMSEYAPKTLGIIPTSATEGDNVTKLSENMLWYTGKSLLQYLEEIDVTGSVDGDGHEVSGRAFFMPVQRVSRPNADFRGFEGQAAYGTLHIGDEITVLPRGERANVSALYLADKETDEISCGEAVTVRLDKEIDASRGDVIARDAKLDVGTLFAATVLWMDDDTLSAGRNYILKLGTKSIPATVLKIRYRISVDDGSHTQADSLKKNEIAVCEIASSDKIVFDEFRHATDGTGTECDRSLGTFLLIDRVTNMTSACGTVLEPIARDRDISRQALKADRNIRAAQKGQKPMTIWFTGLSGAGKSTIANALEERLISMGRHTMLLDGDNIRLGMNRDLGFSQADRVENIRRIAEVAKLMNDAGLIVLVALISPYEKDRKNARDIIGECFEEIYISTPIEICEARDTKGLYRKAREGLTADFTGISSPYEIPAGPDMTIDTTDTDVEECVDMIIKEICPRIQDV